jgi:type VI secretion system protein ImpC
MVGTLSDIRTETAKETQTERASEQPFRMALLGDFSGRASRGEPARGSRLSGVTPLLVDSENMEEVIQRLDVRLALPHGEESMGFAFRNLEDFRPDRLYASEVFQALRQAEAANAQGVEEARGTALRVVLGDPRFQALESAWRSVSFLLDRLERGAHLRIELIDITTEELMEDTLAADGLSASGLFRMLVEEAVGTPGQAPWSALVSLHTFAPSERHLLALERIAGIARMAGAPLLAGADPSFAGCDSIAVTPDPSGWKHPLENSARRMWEELRRHSAANWIGLAMPRFLLRLPYGRDGASIESFAFEEMPQPPVHESYLWGSPAVACVCLLACSFNRYGWNFRPGKISKLDGIPVHIYQREGLTVVTPTAEVWLTESVEERILDLGIMPLASVKNSDSIQLVRFQSIAQPARPLAGPWD